MLIRDINPPQIRARKRIFSKIISILVVIFLITQFFVGMKGSAAEFIANQRTITSLGKYEPQLQVVGTKIYFVWSEITGARQIFTGEMNTDGTGWVATQRTTSNYNKERPQLQVVDNKIYYVWSESDPSYYQIWTAEMNTDGTGWAATKRTTSASSNKNLPQFQVVDSKIYYVWYEFTGSYYQIWTAEMNTDGTGWAAAQRTTSTYNKYEPQLQVVGTKIYYVWYEEDDSFNTQIWTAEINIDGTGWNATQRTTSFTSYIDHEPQLQVVGSKIYYIWAEDDGGSYYEIWTAEMNTDGTGWQATQRTNSGYLKYEHQLQVESSKIYYIWKECDVADYSCTNYYQIWTAEMNTDGTGWQATQRTTTTYNKQNPQLQVIGTKIYYVWSEFDGTYYQIWTGEMNTDGTGWATTKRTISSYRKYTPQLQLVGTKIYYIGTEFDGTYYQIWTGEININGIGWSAIKRTTSTYTKYGLQLQVVGSKIYYVWNECSNTSASCSGGYQQIWTGEMNTDGTGWTAIQRTTSNYSKWYPQFQVDGSKIYYVWREIDSSNYQQIWTGEMNTDGTGWSATQRTTSTYQKYDPQLQVVDSKIYYVWRECSITGTSCTGGYQQISTAEMNTDGSDWTATKRTTSSYNKMNPQLQVVGTKIYYVWQEYDSSNFYQIWTAEISTDGTGWLVTKRTTSAYHNQYPQLQVVGSKIYYVWQESDGTYYQIWTAETDINGSGWIATQRTTSNSSQNRPQFEVGGSRIYYVWYDGSYQIWTGEMGLDLIGISGLLPPPPEEVPPPPPEETPSLEKMTIEGILKQIVDVLTKIIQLYNQLIEMLKK